jgi:hypothetical protein
MKRISGLKRIEIIGGWRKFCNEELCNLYFSPTVSGMGKSKRIRWTQHVACMGQSLYRGFVGKPEGTRPLGCWRSRMGWYGS